LTAEQLTAMESLVGLSAWVVDSQDGTLVGHFDLVAAGDEVRLGG